MGWIGGKVMKGGRGMADKKRMGPKLKPTAGKLAADSETL